MGKVKGRLTRVITAHGMACGRDEAVAKAEMKEVELVGFIEDRFGEFEEMLGRTVELLEEMDGLCSESGSDRLESKAALVRAEAVGFLKTWGGR